MSALLEIRDLHAYYGKSHVLHGVNLHVDAGEIVSLLGRNGVGRSTMVKAAMGQVDATGSICFKGEQLLGVQWAQRGHHGVLDVVFERVLVLALGGACEGDAQVPISIVALRALAGAELLGQAVRQRGGEQGVEAGL